MTDTETLLRKAAMAAGYTPDGKFGRGLLVVRNTGTQDMEAFAFDPINNSGDALDLAAVMRLGYRYFTGVIEVVQYARDGFRRCLDHRLSGDASADLAAATRLAITRAAAAIYDSQQGAEA